ncbi:hypothetical protein [Streptomyces violascens]|uniref:hypothetical protein n=1 Tax=Streptomyces violascens TaxID=67381 RepID=UPI0016783A2C|nr:hypothetical protein [Streptomyces violascens]GGT85176.1 hypothetical protein GCM10010289_00970 [Streptomyces violascens]
MIKKILAGAAFATAATMAIAAPASAQTPKPKPNTTPMTTLQIPTATLQSILAAAAAQGPTASGTGAMNSMGASDFATRNGNTSIAGEAGGILNTYGASLINVDLRCAVPLPEGEGIGGHALGGPKASCNVAPVDQYQAPQKLL